uniref:DnaJ homolog subfamily C member 3 (Trinotate prediction) n=1 Tax=Henneguya salminicola TaxID=69463 RepID=A0A6G3MHW2_HENSL
MLFLSYIFVLLPSLNCQTLIERARIAIGEGKYAQALSFYDIEIEQNNENYLARYLRASLYEVLGKRPQAINDYSKSLEINPKFYKAKLNRALLFIRQGELDKAHTDITEILNIGDSEFSKQCDTHVYAVILTVRCSKSRK